MSKEIRYNKKTSKQLGWQPSWFDATDFNDDLITKIKQWQKKNGLSQDGMVGPATFRRISTERQAFVEDYSPTHNEHYKYIVHDSQRIPIDWDKVVLWTEPNGLASPPGSYSTKPRSKPPTMFVNHWDVCLDSASCAKVLANRGLSVHFCIDNDGTIYQLLDTKHIAWHASGVNSSSVGVEIANAYYPKYQDWYIKNGFGARPVLNNVPVHGRTLEPFLGFYPIQIAALKALWLACNRGIGIKLDYPKTPNGNLSTSVHQGCVDRTFNGICNHYNINENKIDCAGLMIDKLINEM